MMTTEYPVRYVKDDRSRWAGSVVAAVRLRHGGWRPEDEPPCEPGSFLSAPPPPTTREESESDGAGQDGDPEGNGTNQNDAGQGGVSDPTTVAVPGRARRRPAPSQ